MDRYDRARQRGTYDRPLGRQTEAQKRRNDAMAKAAEHYAAAYLGADTGHHPGASAGSWIRSDHASRHARGCEVDTLESRPALRPASAIQAIQCCGSGSRSAVMWCCWCAVSSTADFTRNEWAHGWMSRRELLAQPIIPSELTGTARAIGFDFLHPLAELG